jgi:hypothetical protein
VSEAPSVSEGQPREVPSLTVGLLTRIIPRWLKPGVNENKYANIVGEILRQSFRRREVYDLPITIYYPLHEL